MKPLVIIIQLQETVESGTRDRIARRVVIIFHVIVITGSAYYPDVMTLNKLLKVSS